MYLSVLQEVYLSIRVAMGVLNLLWIEVPKFCTNSHLLRITWLFVGLSQFCFITKIVFSTLKLHLTRLCISGRLFGRTQFLVEKFSGNWLHVFKSIPLPSGIHRTPHLCKKGQPICPFFLAQTAFHTTFHIVSIYYFKQCQLYIY